MQIYIFTLTLFPHTAQMLNSNHEPLYHVCLILFLCGLCYALSRCFIILIGKVCNMKLFNYVRSFKLFEYPVILMIVPAQLIFLLFSHSIAKKNSGPEYQTSGYGSFTGVT